MDDARFDALTKRLAGSSSRRGVLRGFASLSGAGVAALVGRAGVAAAGCASRCDRLPAGAARDQCQAACAAASRARATAQADANQARVWAEALRACQGDASRLCGSGTNVVCCGSDEVCANGACEAAPGPGSCANPTAPCASNLTSCGSGCSCITTTSGGSVCATNEKVCLSDDTTCIVDSDCATRFGPGFACVGTAGCVGLRCGGNGNACVPICAS